MTTENSVFTQEVTTFICSKLHKDPKLLLTNKYTHSKFWLPKFRFFFNPRPHVSQKNTWHNTCVIWSLFLEHLSSLPQLYIIESRILANRRKWKYVEHDLLVTPPRLTPFKLRKLSYDIYIEIITRCTFFRRLNKMQVIIFKDLFLSRSRSRSTSKCVIV